MSDPFESLLESALSSPDLELGHEMRRHLLAAAAPARKAAPDNIVRFEIPDPDGAAGFDWLAGDAPATRPLIRRMSRDPGFFAVLDDERRFLCSLRRSLRKPARSPAAVVVPKPRLHAVIAAAAALTVAAGTLFVVRETGSSATTSVATTAPSSPGKSEFHSPAATPVSTHRAAAPTSSRQVPIGDRAATHPTGVGLPPLMADHADGSSPWPDAPEEVATPAFSLETAASAAFGTMDPAVAMLDSSPEGASALLAAHDSSWSSGHLIETALTTGPALSFDTGDGRTSVPEPGGMLPVMIGCLVLLLHRPKRYKAKD